MKSKLFIISKNDITAEFWLSHLNLEHAQIFSWDNPIIALSNIAKLKPTAIILDDYFSKYENGSWMETAVSQFRGANFIKRIFCVSPAFIGEKQNAASSIPMARCYSFCESLLQKINKVMIEPDESYEYKFWNLKHAELNHQQILNNNI